MTSRIPSPQERLTRPCTRCHTVKPWSEFPARNYWPDGTVRTVLSRCRICQNELNREWQARNREAVRAQHREYMRKRSAAIRAEQERPVNGREGGALPVGPLREFLRDELRFRDRSTLAAAAGVDERTIHRLLTENEWVGLVQADRILTRLGGCLELLYPYDEEMAA